MFKTIDIVLPCYNPDVFGWENIILQNINALKAAFPNLDFTLILVNDGSTTFVATENIEFLKQNIAKMTYISYSMNQGKGFALRKGIESSTADLIVYTDVDFPFELISVQLMLEKLLQGKDIVIGERQFSYIHNLNFYRKILSSGSHFFNDFILRIPFTDTQGGLKGFNQKGKEIFLQTKINRYLFDTEFILRAYITKKMSFGTVPLTLKEGIILSGMGLKVIKKEFLNILYLLKLRYLG